MSKFALFWQRRSTKRSSSLRYRKEEKKRLAKERQEKEREEKERRKRERKATPTGTDLKLPARDLPNIDSRQATKSEVLDICAAVYLYDFEGKRPDKVELRKLLAILIGKKDGPLTAVPVFVN